MLPIPTYLYFPPYSTFNPFSAIQALRNALKTSLSSYSQQSQVEPSQQAFSLNKGQFHSQQSGIQSKQGQEKDKNFIEGDKPSITVISNQRKLRKKQREELFKAEEDSLHNQHTLTLNSPPWKNDALLKKRKSKKINRAQLRCPWKTQRVLRKVNSQNKQKTTIKQVDLTSAAIMRWGISMEELNDKKDNLLSRERLDWSQANPICKLSREMAYFFS